MRRETGSVKCEIDLGVFQSCNIRISDTGVGMTQEEEEDQRIFEPCYTAKEHGLGFGLAIVKEIVAHHKTLYR